MPNRLAQENSLYLRQHAENPVDWYPWGPEALERARAEDKPLLVSVGYSACHWCHVMAHESFENDYIAGLMNRHFVCVKVDREERPDVDQVYMEAVHMLGQRGGWPLNVFCLPDGRPFFGGTYFPPEDRGHNIIPWPQLLMRIAEFYGSKREDLLENAQSITQNLQHANRAPREENTPAQLENAHLIPAARGILTTHDDQYGGFGDAPKFPPAMTLNFLLEIRLSQACEQVSGLAARIDAVVRKTLDAMGRGGLFDQIGGGFARYSVDRAWVIPHFEKMLYDNALLLDLYARGWRRYREPLYRAVVEETVGWLMREMSAPGGAFYASLDADSEGEEGKYYVWRPEELQALLDERDVTAFARAYGVSEAGNFEHNATHLILTAGMAERDRLAPQRATLLAARQKRIPPGLDTKQILSWNALLIRGLAEAAFSFNRADWFDRALKAATALWDVLVEDRAGAPHVYSVYYDKSAAASGEATPHYDGNLDDYAAFAHAWLTLASKAEVFQPGTAIPCMAKATALAATIEKQFTDPDEPGFFFTSKDAAGLFHRNKEWYDNASPAGNSTLVHVFTELYALTGEASYADHLNALRAAYPGVVQRAPSAVSHALAAFTADAVGVAVIKLKNVPAAVIEALAEGLRAKPARKVFLLPVESSEQPTGMQLCVSKQCLAPAKDPGEILEVL